MLLTPAEAQRRVRLAEKVSLLERKLSADPAFSGLQVVQDLRDFRVLVAFKGRQPAISELTRDPELRAVLDVQETRRSRAELLSIQQRIVDAARTLRIESMTFPDFVTGKVMVHVRDVQAFRALIADLNIDDDAVSLIKSESFVRPLVSNRT